jgi:hypothetical protein
MTDRIAIMQKALNLRALAESTSSQNEMMAALAAAEKLMAAYRITEAELAMSEAMGEITVDVIDEFQSGFDNGRLRHKAQACIWNVAAYTETKAVLHGSKIKWMGDRPDVEMAKYLMILIRDGLDRAYDTWKKTQAAVGRNAKGAFQVAMARAINDKLNTMKRQRDMDRKRAVEEATAALSPPKAEELRYAVANGKIQELGNTALILVSAAETKRVAVEDSYRKLYGGVKLGRASGFSYRSGTASEAGRAAGNRFNLSKPLGGNSRAALT